MSQETDATKLTADLEKSQNWLQNSLRVCTVKAPPHNFSGKE